jgi:hypothetical protein
MRFRDGIFEGDVPDVAVGLANDSQLYEPNGIVNQVYVQ